MRSPEGAGKEIFNSTSTRCLPSRRLASSCSRSHRTSWWTRIEAILRTQMFESFGSIVLTKAGPSLFLAGRSYGDFLNFVFGNFSKSALATCCCALLQKRSFGLLARVALLLSSTPKSPKKMPWPLFGNSHFSKRCFAYQELSYSPRVRDFLELAAWNLRSLLCLNLPGMSTAIRAHQITLQNPRGGSIGKQADGQWATGALKEYLPAFNRALASQFCDSICGIPFVESEDPDESFLTVLHRSDGD